MIQIDLTIASHINWTFKHLPARGGQKESSDALVVKSFFVYEVPDVSDPFCLRLCKETMITFRVPVGSQKSLTFIFTNGT
ncbi:MAG: hypothetical protein A2W23_04030 [Planctomycetes bacterium RBG_16_43_13]|nr:MAG: hypothetical protein A2W23_04030 [Planctomycetes bacterium RBG_16_43_13]